jgi:hypothetical protein
MPEYHETLAELDACFRQLATMQQIIEELRQEVAALRAQLEEVACVSA